MENTDPRTMREHNTMNGSVETLCSYCGNACNNGCSWSERFEPVDGWEAIQNKNGWFVVNCPEYCSDDWMHQHPDEMVTEGCIRLLEEFLRMLRNDYIYSPHSRRPIERFIRDPNYKHLFFFADPEDIIAQFRKEMKHTV